MTCRVRPAYLWPGPHGSGFPFLFLVSLVADLRILLSSRHCREGPSKFRVETIGCPQLRLDTPPQFPKNPDKTGIFRLEFWDLSGFYEEHGAHWVRQTTGVLPGTSPIPVPLASAPSILPSRASGPGHKDPGEGHAHPHDPRHRRSARSVAQPS